MTRPSPQVVQKDNCMKECRNCGKELIKRRYESKARFAKKQFCSPQCSRKFMKEHKMGWWKQDILAKRPYSKEDREAITALDEYGLS